MGVAYDRVSASKCEGNQVQRIEKIISVGFNFEIGALSKDRRKSGTFGQGHIDVEVSWAPEGVSSDSRKNARLFVAKHEVLSRVSNYTREIPAGPNERLVTGVVKCAT